MEPRPHPQFIVGLDDYDTPVDAIDALALEPFVRGTEPWARGVQLHSVRDDATLMPEGITPVRWAESGTLVAQLATGPGWTLKVRRWKDKSAYVSVTAVDSTTGTAVLEHCTAGVEESPGPVDSETRVGFWHAGGRGPERKVRNIAIAPWATVRRNYSSAVATALESVMAVDRASVHGRVLLLHGPPGTGKTTALRALAHAWRGWCQLDCVIDPDRFLSQPDYLMGVAMAPVKDEAQDTEDVSEEVDADCQSRWRLIVLEDCDELIRVEAKQGAGQSLARLLNITDGMLGQSMEMIVAITTNEPVGRLHPAILRPGRCLAQIEVGRLSQAEARAWLGPKRALASQVGPEGATLAELSALAGNLHLVREEQSPERIGMYL